MKLGIKNNNKIINGKSIIISGDIHDEMRSHTKQNGTSIAYITEQLFIDYLTKNGHQFGNVKK